MSDVRKLAKIVADHSRQIKGLSGGPQAAYSSIEGGSMDAYDNDGKMRLRIGAQDDGTHAVKYVQGPPPPRPTAPVVSVDGPVVRVRWDGMLMGGHIPEDFARIDVHFALASDDLEADEAVRGNLATSAGNETVLAATSTGTYRVGLVAMSQSRARSEMSDVTEVEVELVNLKGAIDTAVDNASGGSNHYRPAPPEGTDHTENDLWFDTSVDPETGLTAYTPHRWDEAAQGWVSVGDQRTAAIQDAQEQFGQELTDAEQRALDEARDLADQARQDAATDATAKADSARDAAIAEAEVKDQQVRTDIDAVIGGAVSDLEGEIATVRTSVDGKNSITQSTSTPPTQYDGAVGDRWERMSSMGSGGSLISNWRWNGDVWVSTIISDAVLGNVSAAKIGTGFLDAARIEAGSITTDKVLVGAGRNIIPWGQVLAGASTSPHINSDFYGAGTLDLAPADAATGTPPHLVHRRTTNDPGVDRIIMQFLPAPPRYSAARGTDGFAVAGGTWSYSITAYTPVSNLNARLSMVAYDAQGGWAAAATSDQVRVGSQKTRVEMTVTIPESAAYIIPYVHSDQPGDLHIVGPELAPAIGATLIEDGAITTEKVAAKAIEAGKIAAGAIEAEHIVAGGIEADSLIVAGSLGETLIADGAISTRTVQADAIGAEAIAAGVIEGDHVRAGSLTADKLLVGRGASLIPFSDERAKPHTTGSGFTLTATTDGDLGKTLLIQGGAGASGWTTAVVLNTSPGSSMVPVMPGAEYRFSAAFGAGGAGAGGNVVRLAVTWYTSSGSVIPGSSFSEGMSGITYGYPPDVHEFAVAAPSNAATARISVQSDGPILGSLFVKDVKFERRVGGTLIEDGAVTTRHIEAGSITAESGIIGSFDAGVINVGEMNGARIEAGTIDTPQLAFGAATGDVLSVDALNFKTAVGLDIRSSAFRAGDAVEITEDFGIRQFGPDGALNVSLPSDGSPAEFRGDLSARTLTATGRMSIQGPGAIASGGVLELESGVVPPVAGPQITNAWQRVTFPPVGEKESPWGLVWADGHWWRAVQTTNNEEGATARLEKITTDGELVLSFPIEYRSQVNGITVLGDTIYVLGWPRGFGGGDRYVLGYDYVGNEVARWVYSHYGTGTYQPTIGNDGTNIVIAQSWADGWLTWRKFNPATGATLSRFDAESRMLQEPVGIHFGDFDYGARRMVLTIRRTSGDEREQFLVYEDRAGASAHRELPWFAANMDNPVGSDWVDGRFYSLGSDGHLYSYEPHESNRLIGDGEDDWWGAVTWATGSQETTSGPATRFRYLHRSQLRVQNGDVPQGVENARFYTGKGVAEPDRTDMRWVATFTQPHEPSRILSLPAYSSGSNPPAQNTFTNDTPGEIRSAIGGFRVDGAGSGEWGSFNFHGDGSVTGKGTSITGIINHPPIPNGGNEHDVTVTFPAGRFTEPPVIVLTNSNGHLTPTVNRSRLTATSFQVRTWNFSTGNAGENITTWIAVED